MPNNQGERAQLNVEFRDAVQAWRRDYEARAKTRITIGEALEYLGWQGLARCAPFFTPGADTSPQGFGGR